MKPITALVRGAALLAFLAPTGLRAAVVRFPAQAFSDGRALPAHASASGEPSDAAAAKRRTEILRSPWLQVSDEVAPRPDLRLAFERAVPPETREKVRDAVLAMGSALEGDGWQRVGKAGAPLTVLVTAQGTGVAAAGWEGREGSALVRPVIAVPGAGRPSAAVAFDAARQLALLSLRQGAPDAASWAVEGIAEYLARRRAGLDDDPAPSADPLLAETGALTDPAVLAEYLPLLVRRLPRGVAELRAAWEDSGSRRGDESEALLRTLSSRGDARGVAGLLGDLLVRRLTRTSAEEMLPGARRPLPAGGIAGAAPPPMGWRRLTFRSADESGGLEIAVADAARCATGRVVIGYRGDGGAFDATDLVPGTPRRVPLSGTARVGLLLVDGRESGDVFVDMRRLRDYPAALASSSVEWTDGAVRLAWRTASHRDLLAWVVSRTDETEGEARESQRRIVPTSESDEDGFAYQLDDPDVVAGHRYRYRVFALTTDGILSEAFDAPVLAGR